nr:hypothetical protein L204_03923 [Cryptococcus depauperatus CBS 7855]
MSKLHDFLPVWERISLPPASILAHLTDAHCHPTDLFHSRQVYQDVPLRGIAAMATVPEDQEKVKKLSVERLQNVPSKESNSVEVVACFGYHPWFTHRYTLHLPGNLPCKWQHYSSLFLQPSCSTASAHLLGQLLPFLPDPVPFALLCDGLKRDLKCSRDSGRPTMLGEVGLDSSARLRWPVSARHLHPDFQQQKQPLPHCTTEDCHADGAGCSCESFSEQDEQEWKRLTPFKVPMGHQREILRIQMEIAIELGMPMSLHSVACPGPTLEALVEMKEKHGAGFISRINIDLHSAGSWSPAFFSQAIKQLPNLYASPSILITGRSSTAPDLIRAIPVDRMLVESDTHDVRQSARLVWAATVWIAACKGWKLEGRDAYSKESQCLVKTKDECVDWDLEFEEEYDERGRLIEEDVWCVKTLKQNWSRFMGILE